MENKTIISVMIGIFLISLVSASEISISPSVIQINGFPGLSFQENISIFTSGNFAVYLSATNISGITTNFTSPIIVEKEKTVSIDFYLANDIEPKNYTIYLTASTEAPIEIITVPSDSGSHGGGGGSFIQNIPKNITNTNQTVQNKSNENQSGAITDLDTLKQLNKQFIQDNTILQEENKKLTDEKNILNILTIVFGLGTLAGIIYMIYSNFKFEKHLNTK